MKHQNNSQKRNQMNNQDLNNLKNAYKKIILEKDNKSNGFNEYFSNFRDIQIKDANFLQGTDIGNTPSLELILSVTPKADYTNIIKKIKEIRPSIQIEIMMDDAGLILTEPKSSLQADNIDSKYKWAALIAANVPEIKIDESKKADPDPMNEKIAVKIKSKLTRVDPKIITVIIKPSNLKISK